METSRMRTFSGGFHRRIEYVIYALCYNLAGMGVAQIKSYAVTFPDRSIQDTLSPLAVAVAINPALS